MSNPFKLFTFRLALALGCTRDELLQRISNKELSEWMAYYQVEPFGEERADIRNAINCCVSANLHSTKNHKIDDFIPQFVNHRRRGRITGDEIRNEIRNYSAAIRNAQGK